MRTIREYLRRKLVAPPIEYTVTVFVAGYGEVATYSFTNESAREGAERSRL